jgi:hypothetical protein
MRNDRSGTPLVRSLATVAVLLALALTAQLAALTLRPPSLQYAPVARALGPQGEQGRSALGTALCAVDLGLSPRSVLELERRNLAELERWLMEREIGPAARQRLLGLGEALLSRYDYARLFYDMALIPPESARWQLAREREHGRMAAARVLGEEEAERYEAALFGIWEERWREVEAGLDKLGGAPGTPAVTDPAGPNER